MWRMAAKASARAKVPPRPSALFHKIRSLEVEGGFLDRVRLDFAEHHNCVIGARGTGKTTVLEFLRHALRDEPRRAPKDSKLVKDNLAKGTIRVEIETREGVRYTVERIAEQSAQVFTERGEPAGFKLAHGTVFDVDIYGQNEIEAIAGNVSAQLQLIDRFVSVPVNELERKLRAIERQLDANASDVLSLEGRLATMEEGLSELPALQDKLQAQQPTGADAEALRHELALKGLRDREVRTLTGIDRFLQAGQHAIAEASRTIDGATNVVPPEVRVGPNGASFDALARTLQACRDEALERFREVRAVFERCAQEARDAGKALEDVHREQEARYREVTAKHEHDRARATERHAVQQRLNELLDQQRSLAEVKAALEARHKERRDLMQQLVAARDERFGLRKGVATRLSQELSTAGIRVSLTQDAGSETYRDLLAGALKGEVRSYQSVAQSLANSILPRELAELIRANRPDRIVAKAAAVTEAAAEQVISRLSGSSDLHRIEVAELADEPRIVMRDGATEKDSSSLSTGQRCTTILPILLLESEKPLLIDQPEDNLDNRFIYEAVVSQVREVKRRRQLIFVTHNPNIPVGGAAERVFLMDSDGKSGRLVAHGDVDEMKDHVQTILEGGAAAFEERRKRYAH